MKKDLIESLMVDFIRTKDFVPIRDEQGNIQQDLQTYSLYKMAASGFTIVEFIDADSVSVEEIQQRLSRSGELLNEMKVAEWQYVFQVYLFATEPDLEKLKVINEGQVHSKWSKRFLKCHTVNVGAKRVIKHFRSPMTDFGISKVITTRLTAGVIPDVSMRDVHHAADATEHELTIDERAKTPILTYALLGINILIWGAMNLYATQNGKDVNQLLMDWGAKENAHILAGEYWRFFTAMFLHANFIHLAMNCYSLYAFGSGTERIFGHARYGVIYLLAGLAGNVASFVFSSDPGVGASGAIFGLVGAMLFYGIQKPALFKAYLGTNIISILVINLGYGFSHSGIDNFAHIGGFIGGFLVTGAIHWAERPKWYLSKAFFAVIMVIVLTSGLVYGFTNPTSRAIVALSQIEKLEKAAKWAEVQSICSDTLKLNINANLRSSVLWSLVKSEALQNKYSQAVIDAKRLVAIDPVNGHYLLGLIYYDTRQYGLAQTELQEAKRLQAPYQQIDEILNDIKSKLNP